MEGRGLTLRSKSRRPQISAPKPISAPLPANSKASGAGLPSGPREKPQQNGATADLVKRRYSTRFNQVPDLDANAPPVPSVPALPGAFGGRDASPAGNGGAASGSSPGLRVDLSALRDPSLPVDKCKCGNMDS